MVITDISEPRSLRAAAVDGDEADGLSRQVVGGFDVRLGEEAEVAVRILAKALRQVVGLSAEGCSGELLSVWHPTSTGGGPLSRRAGRSSGRHSAHGD